MDAFTPDSKNTPLLTPPAVVGADVRPEDSYKDILLLEYPNEEDAIREYRSFGVSDMTIRREMADFESELIAFGVSRQAIDEEFGRTAETKIEAMNQTRKRQAHLIARNMNMPVDEVEKITALAEYFGYSPNLMLQNKELREGVMNWLEQQGVKITESSVEQFWNSVKAQQLNRDKLQAWTTAAIQGRNPKDDAYIQNIDEQLEKLGPPVMQSLFQETVAGAGQFLTQQAQNIGTGAKGAGIGGAMGGVAGFVVAGPTGVIPGAKAGGRLGFAVGGMFEGWTQEVGAAYEEFLNITDNEGNSIDTNLARLFAIGFGTMSSLIEYAQMKTFMNSFAANPTLRNRILSALAGAGIDYVKEVTEEIGQRAVVITGRELMKYVNGTENASPGEIAGELAEEARGAAVSFALPFAASGSISVARQYNNKTAGMKKNKAAGAEIEAEAQRIAALQKKIASGEADSEAGESGYVFVPKSDVEALFQTATGDEAQKNASDERRREQVLQSLGIDPETYESTAEDEEIAISAESFDANPIQSDNVRRGAAGETAREEMARLQKDIEEKMNNPLYADTEEAQEALKLQREVEQLTLDAGGDPSVAVQGSTLWANHAIIVAREMNIPVRDAMNLIVQRATQEMEDAAAQGEMEGLEQTSFHGGPTRGIERMSTDFIGTGEGQQVYGWGIYSAEERAIAENYKRDLSGGDTEIKSFSFGDVYVYRNGNPVDYSPRTSQTKDIVKASLIEDILIKEWDLKQAYEKSGADGVKQFVRELIEGQIEDVINDNGADSEYAKEAVPVLRYFLKGLNRGFIYRAENLGQLYRLEVPESDVLLDWDKPLSEQPEIVRKQILTLYDEIKADDSLREKFADTYELLERALNSKRSVKSDPTGDDVYNSIGYDLGSDKAASKYLNSLGIPGLQYLDSESRANGEGTHNFVVWDEGAMEIMETYYQMNRDVDLDQNVPVFDATEFFREGITDDELMKHLDSLANQPFGTLNGDAIIKVLRKIGKGKNRQDKARHVIHSGAPVRKAFQGIRKAGVLSIENLIANSVMVESIPNTKKDKKSDVEMYHRFYVPMGIGENIFTLRLVTEETKDHLNLNPMETILYDVVIENKTPLLVSQPSDPVSGRGNAREGANEITIREMLSGVKDSEGNPYVLQQSPRFVRGMFHVDPETANRIVTLFKAQNRSTFIHEIGHAFLEDLQMMAERDGASEQVRQDWETVREWLGMGEGQARPTREQHEKFADGFLNYIETGRAPTKALRGVFLRIKGWLRELFEVGEIQRIEISDEVRQVYDRLLAAPDAVDAEYRLRSSFSDIEAQIPATREDAERTQRILDALNDPASLEDLINRLESGEADSEPAEMTLEDAGEAIADAVQTQISEWEQIQQADEQARAEAENPKSRSNVIGFIKANGYINYAAVKDRYGPVDATQLRKKLGPGLFRKNGFGLDEFVAMLEHEGAIFENGDEIFETLMSDGDTNRALTDAYRKGIEEGKAHAEQFLEVYEAWKTALAERAQNGETIQFDSGELLQTGFNAIETIRRLQTEAKESGQTIAKLSRQVQALMANLTGARTEAKVSAEQAADEQARRSEKERELDILAEVADKLIGRAAKQEDRIAALKAMLADSKREIKDDTKIIKIYSREVDRLLGKNARLADKNEWQKNMIAALKVLLRHEESRHKMADRLADRLKAKLEALKAKQKLQRETKRMLNAMTRAAKSKSVAWERRQQIKEILATVNLRDRNRKTDRVNSPVGDPVQRKDGERYRASDSDRRAAIEALIEQYGEEDGKKQALDQGFTKRDLELLKLSSMDKISFEELQAVHAEIIELSEIGKRERAEQTAREKEEVRRETDAQMTELRKDTAGRPPVILGSGEGKKRYSFAAAKQDTIRREQALETLRLEDEILNGLELTPEEYAARVVQIHSEVAERIEKDFAGNLKRGLKRKGEYLTDEIISVIMDRHRLFDLLDGGSATFNGPFTKFWVVGMNRLKDAMQREIDARIGKPLEDRINELGLSRIKLNEQTRISDPVAKAFFGAQFPIKAQLIGLYVLIKDEDARRSLVKGNFNGVPMAEALIDRCIAELSDAEKALGDFIFGILNNSDDFDRANRVMIAVTGEGMDKIDRYVTIFRVERNPHVAEIDKKAAMSHVDSRGRPEKLDPGFTHSRVNASTAIETDIFKVLTRHVREEEHFIAFGKALKEARSLMFQPDPKNPRLTMARAINEKHGNYVFRRLVEEYNKLAMPDILKAQGVFDKTLGRFISGKAIAALCYNVATYLKNYASIPKWFIEANPIDVLAALADYAQDSDGFYERVFAMDPQLAQRQGSYVQTLMNEGKEESRTFLEDAAKLVGGEKARELTGKAIDVGMNPSGWIDKWVASVMFDSVYRSGLRRNLTSERARDEAQRAVQRLMQPSDAMELPSLYLQGGLWRTLLMFTTEAAKNMNIVFYDIPRQVKNGDYAKAGRSAFAIALSAVLVKMLSDGIWALGDSKEGEGGEDEETFMRWLFAAIMEGFVGEVPVLGPEIMGAIEGNSYSKNYSMVSDPFWKIWFGVKKILEGGEDDGARGKLMRNGYTKKEWGVLSMAQGFSLLTGAPYTQLRRIYMSRNAQDIADILLINIGNKKAVERAQQNAKKRNAANY